MELFDIHTHQIPSETFDESDYSCILNVYPQDFEVTKSNNQRCSFSCGLHPWYSEDNESQLESLSEIASHSRIIAIGETGLDKVKGPSFDIQIPVFKHHIIISEQLKKPLIIHAVKAWEELYHIRKKLNPTQPWIIHGFRGNSQIAQQMAGLGFMFSLGNKFNSDSLSNIPLSSLFCETDDEKIDIKDVYQQVANALGIDIEDLAIQIAANIHRIFPNF